MLIHKLYNHILGTTSRPTNSAQRETFIIALTTTKRAIAEAIDTGSLAPLQRIIDAGRYRYTISMVEPALQLLQGRNLQALSMISNRVTVPYPGGATIVEFDAIHDSSTDQLIFLSSSANRMADQMGIFTGLISNFPPTTPMGQFTEYVYWVLSRAPGEVTIPCASVTPRNRQEIVDAVFQLMNAAPTSQTFRPRRAARTRQSPPPPPPRGVNHPPSS